MRKLIHIICLILFMSSLSACTQNNGDIGPLFGFWRLNELTCDGEPVAGYEAGDEIWSFQNNIIFIQTLGEAHDYEERVGTWTRHDNILSIDFTHWNAETDIEYYFKAPAILNFSDNQVNDLTVETITSDNLVLKMIAEDGSLMGYTLKKVY